MSGYKKMLKRQLTIHEIDEGVIFKCSIENKVKHLNKLKKLKRNKQIKYLKKLNKKGEIQWK